jgi:eukaryotic-like serine/threonine-protein kinase
VDEPGGIPCPDENKLCALFEGVLAPSEAAAVDAHAAGCTTCHELLGRLGGMFAGSSADQTSPSGEIDVSGAPARIAAGTTIGRYIVLGSLGIGAMGVVYAAHDPELDRKVALKLVRADVADEAHREVARALIVREAKAIARVSHPNVVGVYDVGTYADRIFLAMELVSGTTLTEWLSERPRPWREVLPVFVAAGRGLAAAHAAGIVHRDFKPDNVLVGNDERVKVADFGLARARLTDPPPHELPETPPRDAAQRAVLGTIPRSTLVGTPAYMAPEQRAGKEADARSDQYAFCVAFYEALYGRRPEGDVRSPRPSRGVPAWLHRAILVGLRPSADQRHPSMDVLLDGIEEKPRRQRRLRWLVFAAAILSLLAGTALVRVHERRTERALICQGAEQDVARIWDVHRRQSVIEAFTKTGQPFAERAATRVSALMDGYAQDWAKSRTDACAATRLRGEQSEAVLDRRMHCLDRRLGELATLGDELGHADGPVVERAVRAAEGLVPVSTCSAARVRAEGDASTARGLEDAQTVELLSRAKTAHLVGKYAEATRLGQAALDGARAHHAPFLEAEALEILGLTAGVQQDGQRAGRLLFDAFATADEVGASSIAADAATDLVWALSLNATPSEEADKWVRLAASAIRRMGGDDDLTARLANAHALVLLRSGKYRDARDEARRAVRLIEGLRPATPLRLASALNTLSQVLHSLGDYEEAKLQVERAIALFEHELGEDHPKVGLLIYNLAGELEDQGRHEESLQLLTRALSTFERAGEQTPHIPVAHATVGRVLAQLGRYDEANRHLLRATALAEANPAIPKPLLARIYADRGFVERSQHRYPDALAHYERSLALYQASGLATHPGAVGTLVGLGRVHLERGKAAAALPFLEQAGAALGADAVPFDRAEARFALAQALSLTGKDQTRARELAFEAREFYRQEPAHAADVREIEAWFSKNAKAMSVLRGRRASR